jgi:hypothetical protein
MGNRVLVKKSEGKRTLGISRRRWYDIKLDLYDVGVGRNKLDQDMDSWRALANAEMNLWVPKHAGNFLNS